MNSRQASCMMRAWGDAREGVNKPAMPARTAKTAPLIVANARRSTSYACALRLDWRRFDDPLEHGGFIHTF